MRVPKPVILLANQMTVIAKPGQMHLVASCNKDLTRISPS